MAYTTINKSSSYFNTILYTGDATSPRSITGVGFQPDLTWVKNRSQAGSNGWYDAVRGTGAANNFSTDSASVPGGDGAGYGFVSAFNADGISVTAGTVGSDITNKSGSNYVDWNWLANNTSGSSNTAGSITATVAANTTSGFSIGKTTGTLSSGTITVGHGLGVAPSMILWKRSDGTSNWQVYHKSNGTNLLQLNSSGASSSGSFWPATSSTTFSVSNSLYGSGEVYAFYCWSEIKGYSKFGSYTGNGSSLGNFIYTGFKPAFVLVKSTSSADNWFLMDNKRDSFNPEYKIISPNTNSPEDTANLGVTDMDLLSNGFRLTTNWSGWNNSGQTNIYMAFAENPFVTSGGIPVTAR